MAKLDVYPFDRVGTETEANAFFGCGLTYNTAESSREVLPRRVRDRYVITADAIIDNRSELFREFSVPDERQAGMTDSELIMLAYERWGHDCPKRLLGDYAFAIWDGERQELYCARDAVGTRALYYYERESIFGFCTVEQPLLGTVCSEVELNERWLADFLAIDSIHHETEAGETVYQGIRQMLPAHYGVWGASGLRTVQYWNPLEHPPIRFNTDEEYVTAFLDLFQEAVSCRLRSAGDIGIMLSGGMDSGSIGCVAAGQLAADNKRLQAYSSIPVRDFQDKPESRADIYDESGEIDLIGKAYPNINITYCDCAEHNAWADMDDLLQVFGSPYKVFRNMSWYRPILRQAAADGCRVMLNGQVGNGTISYGEFVAHFLSLFRSGRWIAAYREIRGLARIFRRPVKQAFKFAIRATIPYQLRDRRARRRQPAFDRFHNVIVNRLLIEKWGVEERLDRMGANLLTTQFRSYEEEKPIRVSPLNLSHIGAIETKLSLETGIMIRDASRDRRIVEFCLSIPSDQYVRHGNERYLLRRAMTGILPDSIRNNIKTKGVQSADWLHRLQSDWPDIRKELERVAGSEHVDRYLDMDKVRRALKGIPYEGTLNDAQVAHQALVAVIVGKFLRTFHHNYSNNRADKVHVKKEESLCQ
nr:asparagine synthase-related protein [Paenibacillus soyae]